MTYYILDADGEPREATRWEWAHWFEANPSARVVGRTDISGDGQVSTVFLSVDHQWLPSGPPLLYETMIFGGRWDQYQWRWSTRAEAVAGHARIVAALRACRSPEDEQVAR